MDGKLSRYIEIDVGLPKYEKISQKKGETNEYLNGKGIQVIIWYLH